MKNIENRDFTPRAQQAIANASKEARRLGHNFVGGGHILLGIIKLGPESTAARVLASSGITQTVVSKIESALSESLFSEKLNSDHDIPLTPRVYRILSFAKQEADRLGASFAGTEHLLLGLLGERENQAAEALCPFYPTLEDLRRQVIACSTI
ncbi:MAG: Clp protease N-terminal domain-containing protein [Patescibacteria group bacterium]